MTIDPTLDIEYQVRAFLLADADVASVVGTRVFPAPAPQNTAAPFVTLQRVSTERVYSDDGYSKLCGPLLQIDCWSDAPEYAGSYLEAKKAAQAVRHALNGFRGMMGPLRVQETTIETEHDLFDAQDRTRRVSYDFRFWHDDG